MPNMVVPIVSANSWKAVFKDGEHLISSVGIKFTERTVFDT